MKRVLSIQDISCVGKCSLTVALPIISAAGIECAILPTAVLSTHTAFKGFTFRDLTEDLDGIADHWKQEKSCMTVSQQGISDLSVRSSRLKRSSVCSTMIKC